MSKPFLMIVTGRPGSGKSTLARKLADNIHCPALCRDEIKEGYVHTHGMSHETLAGDTNLAVLEAFFETIDLLISKKVSLITEAAFQHKLWAPRLKRLQHKVRLRIVVCSLDPALARERRIQRGLADSARERFHGDTDVRMFRQGLKVRPGGEYQPPDLAVPILNVDTSDGYVPGLEQIVSFLLSP